MIKAEEAIQLASSYKENYRKQERITLENNVSKWVEDAAKEGKYSCIVEADPKDSDYIIEKLQENGFKCEVAPMGSRYGENIHIKVCWGHQASTPKTTGRSLAQEFLKRLEQKP